MLLPFYGDKAEEVQVGVDEAGRGCLAFGVTACALIWDTKCTDPLQNLIKDSKVLSVKKRSLLRNFIEKTALDYCVYTVPQGVIDDVNILNATYMAMHHAIDAVAQKRHVDRLLIDGNRFQPYKDLKHECIIGGDNKYIAIAAASILAKTYRDEMVTEIVKNHDNLAVYGFDKNKGYGTATHINAIRNHGITPYHRKTFGVVKDFSLS